MSETAQGPGTERRRQLWAETLALALAYYAAGKLSWFLAISPGRGVVVWPPVGIAIGVLLGRGLSRTPGVALGALALAAEALQPAWGALGPVRTAAVAGVLASAAALEAASGAMLARLYRAFPSALGDTRAVLRLALVTAPSSAVGATVWTAALVWSGVLAQAQAGRSLLVTGIGHLLGAVLLTPIVLLALAPAGASWRRRVAVMVPVAVAAALAVWVFVRATRWDDHRAREVMRARGEALTAAAGRSLALHLDTLRTLADFLGSDRPVDAATFRRMASGTTVRQFAYRALVWAPAADDGARVPVELLEPRSADRGLVGLNLASDPTWRATLSASRRDGRATALPIGAAPGEPTVFLLVPAAGPKGEHGVEGFVGALLRLDLMIDRAVAGLPPEGVGLELADAAGMTLHHTPHTPDDAARPFAAETLTVADRRYTLTPVVGRAALVELQNGELWIVLVAGMLFVALLEGVLLVLTGRRLERGSNIPSVEVHAAANTTSSDVTLDLVLIKTP